MGTSLVFSDTNSLEASRVRRWLSSGGIVATVAGTANPAAFALDSYGLPYCVNGPGNGGPATSACLLDPSGLAVDASNNLYVSDASNDVVKKINSMTGIITTVVGSGAQRSDNTSRIPETDGGNVTATDVNLRMPQGMAFLADGTLLLADAENHCIRRVNLATSHVVTYVRRCV